MPPFGAYELNQGWLFGGAYVGGAEAPRHPDDGFQRVTLPHTVTPLSWGDWDPRAWEGVWIYRRRLALTAAGGPARALVDFDGVMTNATVYLDGVEIARHQGGYLPFTVELTPHLIREESVLAVIVDARWLDVPPGGHRGGARSIDYLQPGGIYRDVRLRIVPEAYLADVFVKPCNVLSGARSIDVQATIDAGGMSSGPLAITTELLDGPRRLALATGTAALVESGAATATVTIGDVGEVDLWSPETPTLYEVRTTVSGAGAPSHAVSVRTGFRQATFEPDGLHLNGERRQVFGLNRHQLFPYTGMAAPARLQRRDAELLRHELNCNMVRCSHYPQSPHFLDACDELGIMVWQETPGWQYVGGRTFRRIVLRNVRDMVIRDRNRPSVIVWGTRLNESANHRRLYAETRRLADELDGTRATSGAVDFRSTRGWAQDVFAYDDYHSSGDDATLQPPLSGIPYMVSEAVGALSGAPLYRWIDPGPTVALQARMHARVHDIPGSVPGHSGVLGWAAIDYASLNGGERVWHALKWPGVLDTFRVPKPGAAIYRSQVDPATRPVILPTFYWDFGPGSPAEGPGPGALIATNCDRLELFVGGRHLATGVPDRRAYGGLAHPPVLVNLTVDASGRPELRIDGYVGDELVASRRMSADPSGDRLGLAIEDASIEADGSDATRCTFRALDAHGNPRPFVGGAVSLTLSGPATLIAQNPFDFGTYGGVGGAFVRSQPGRTGVVTVVAEHPTLGRACRRVNVTAACGER